MSDMQSKLSLLTDFEVNSVLNRVLTGYSEQNPDFPFEDEQVLSDILNKISTTVGQPISPAVDKEINDVTSAKRFVLRQLAQNPEYSSIVEAAIDHNRDVLRAIVIEPITTTLVMVALVLVLKTKFDVKIERKNGQVDYQLSVSGSPADESIIKQILSILA